MYNFGDNTTPSTVKAQRDPKREEIEINEKEEEELNNENETTGMESLDDEKFESADEDENEECVEPVGNTNQN